MSNLISAFYHGGHCCGMSHIYNFPIAGPDAECSERTAVTPLKWGTMVHWNAQYYGRMYVNWYARPKETAKERLIGLLNTMHESRHRGIIEVVLTDRQKVAWDECLKEIGFKEVNSHGNSNTGNTLTVYHLNTI